MPTRFTCSSLGERHAYQLRRQLGASTAEYIVLVAVLMLGLIGALRAFQSSADEGLAAEADDLYALAQGNGMDRPAPPGGGGPVGQPSIGASSAGLGATGAVSGRAPADDWIDDWAGDGSGDVLDGELAGVSARGELWSEFSAGEAGVVSNSLPSLANGVFFLHKLQGWLLGGLSDVISSLDADDGDRREDGLLSSVGGFFIGIAESAVGMVEGVVDLAKGLHNISPWRALYDPDGWKQSLTNLKDGVVAIATNPKAIWDTIVQPIKDDWNAGRPGEAVGRIFLEIVGVFVGTKGADKAAKTGKASQIAGVLNKADEVADVGTLLRNQRRYTSNGRAPDNLLLNKNLNTRSTKNITEWRRTVRADNLAAERKLFLGDDFVKVDKGTWRSLDGKRQFRVVESDYLGKHGIGKPTVEDVPHVHFEFLDLPRKGGNKFRLDKNVHVPLEGGKVPLDTPRTKATLRQQKAAQRRLKKKQNKQGKQKKQSVGEKELQ